MKKTLKLGFVAILAVIAVAFGALTASLFNPKKAYAADNNFNMVAGASVRLSDENRGIRFTAEFSKDFLDEEAAYRMMIIPADWLTKYSLTAGADYYKTLVEDNNLTNVAVMNCTPFVYGENYRIQGSLTDIQEKNLNRKWFGIAYREKDNARVYADFNDGENQRSICEVAGAALNDLTENYSEDSKTYLTNQVLNTYKKVSGNSEATMDNVKSLYTITTDNTNFLITKGDSKELSYTLTATDNTIADKLGLKLGYYSDNGELMTVADDGTVTASSENSGMVTVGAVLLGEKVTDKAVKAMVRSEMAGNMLEDYADECSKSQFARDMQKDVNGNVATEWLSDFNGRNGVVKLKSGVNTILSSGSVDGNAGCVRFFYNRSYEQMINLDFDYISIWAYFEKGDSASEAETVDIKNGSLVLGSALEFGKWTELKIAKSDFSKTFYTSYEKFCARHDQAVMHDGIANNGTMILSTGIEGINVYLDGVAFVKAEVTGDAPVAGVEYTVPDVKLLGIDGKVLETQSVVTATRNGVEVTVADNKIANIYRGTYNLAYKITAGNNVVSYDLTYNVGMAANTLEDFDDSTSVSSVKTTVNGTYADTAFYATWHESFAGRVGVVETVTTIMGGYGQAKINIRFNRTYEELTAMCEDFDYVSMWVYIDAENYFGVATHNNRYIKEADEKIKGGEWQEIRMSKEDIENSGSYYASQYSKLTAIEAFKEVHSKDKSSYNGYLFALCSGGTKADSDGNYGYGLTKNSQFKVYIDSISFGKNA